MEKGEGERRKGLGTYIQQALVGSLVVVVIRVAGKGGRGHNAMRKETTQ
jgi:hypothetical protein